MTENKGGFWIKTPDGWRRLGGEFKPKIRNDGLLAAEHAKLKRLIRTRDVPV